MFQSLLVPLDGSRFAEHALPAALTIARRANAKLRLARVRFDVEAVYGGGELAPDPKLLDSLARQEREYMEATTKRVSAAADSPVTSALLDAPIADALNEHARAERIDLIAMATHGRGGVKRFWLGSVADRLLRQTSIPLLLVRPVEGNADLSSEFGPKQMLIPLDASSVAEEILTPAVSLGKLFDAEYALVYVIEPVVVADLHAGGSALAGFDPKLSEQLQAEAQTYLEGVADRLRAQSLKVRTRVVLNQPAATGILEEARASGAGIIAIATHGRRGLTRFFLGSVADKVVRGCSIPVLVHRPVGKP
jgi:nucleotide-binding universal stress UspA family protein